MFSGVGGGRRGCALGLKQHKESGSMTASGLTLQIQRAPSLREMDQLSFLKSGPGLQLEARLDTSLLMVCLYEVGY